MNECRLYEENGRSHFMTKRFDRVDNSKLHMQTFGAIAHINYNYPGLSGYEEAANVTMQLTKSVSDVEELYRRMVFNVIMVNQDDHVKNISFLMDKKGSWKLAPAYDLTFAYNPDNTWLKAHQMRINGKLNNITHTDLIESGKLMGLKRAKCEKIISQIQNIAENFSSYMLDAGVDTKTIQTMLSIIRRNNNEI